MKPKRLQLQLPSGRIVDVEGGGDAVGFTIRSYESDGSSGPTDRIPVYAMRAILAFFAKELEEPHD